MTYTNRLPMCCWAEDDRPASKMMLKGKAAISDAELLSIIIARNSQDLNCLDTARKVLNSCKDNLGEMACLSVTDLAKRGLSRSMAIRVITAFEIGRRRMAVEATYRDKIQSSKDAYEILRSVLNDKPYEEFWILLLNRANRVLQKVMISEGGISGTVVDPKKIFKVALDNHTSSIILGHYVK